MDVEKRDKVIKGLSIHGHDAGIPNQCEIFGCPYRDGTSWCSHELAKDAGLLIHELIEKQEMSLND